MARKGMNIYKRKDGRWEGRVKLQFEAKYRSVYGKTYGETRDKVIHLQKQTAVPVKKCDLTVKELFELWLLHIKHKIKASSYANYAAKLELHIYPVLGSLKFETLTHKHINDFINQKLSDGRIGGGALSDKYVLDMVVLIKCVGKFAESEHNYSNPIRNVKMPKVRKKELFVPSKYTQQLLIEHLKNNLSERNLGILLCLFTGIRLGELCSLKWGDVNLNERFIRISKTVQRIKSFDGDRKTELVITSPKSEKSNREIPLQTFLIEMLTKHKKQSDSYILSGTDKLIEPRLMQYYFKTVLKKVKQPSFNFHTLRHIFATNCIAVGFDVKTLSELLGHSSVELTLNRYVHSSKERKRKCMELLNLVS